MSDTGVNVTINGKDATAAAVETARSRLKAKGRRVRRGGAVQGFGSQANRTPVPSGGKG